MIIGYAAGTVQVLVWRKKEGGQEDEMRGAK